MNMGSGGRRNILVSTAICMLLVNLIAMFSELTRTLSSSAPPSSKSLTILEPSSPSHQMSENDPFLCAQNPYVSALGSTLEDISSRMDTWLHNVDRHRTRASGREMSRHDHARFFPFQVLEPCQQKACVGGKCHQDTSKIVCGLEQLRTPTTTEGEINDDDNCVIYSIGGNNWWQFEKDLLQKTCCEIHTFDCTGPLSRFHKPNHERLHFHHICLGTQHEGGKTQQECERVGDDGNNKCGETWTLAEIQNRLQHKRIDLLKMDIEGFEWPLLESWPELDDQGYDEVVLPMQILVEIHYQTQFEELRPPNVGVYEDFKSSFDMVELQAHLLRMGYIVVERDDNKFCRHCTELTLIHSRCPREDRGNTNT